MPPGYPRSPIASSASRSWAAPCSLRASPFAREAYGKARRNHLEPRERPMEIIDLKAAREFSLYEHVHKSLKATPQSDISISCGDPGHTSPIHHHPGTDEIYHVIDGRGVFNDGRIE